MAKKRKSGIQRSPLDNFTMSDLRAIQLVLQRLPSDPDGILTICAKVDEEMGLEQKKRRRPGGPTYDVWREFEKRFDVDQKVAFGTNLTPTAEFESERQRQLGVVRHLLRHFEGAVLHLQEAEPPPMRDQIIIGVSTSLTPYFVPEVVREFRSRWERQKYDAATKPRGKSSPSSVRPYDFEIIVEHALPHELIDAAAKHLKYDLVITSCDPTKIPTSSLATPDGRSLTPANFELPMFLLVDRRSQLARVPERTIKWSKLKGTTVLIQDFNRDPIPPYPPELFANNVRTRRQQSYLEAYASCLGGGPVACLGFPQLMDTFQRARLKAIRPAALGLGAVNVVLIPCERARDNPGGRSFVEIIEGLYERFYRALQGATKYHFEGGEDQSKRIGPSLRRTYSCGRNERGDWEWTEGVLNDVMITPDGFLNADHTVKFDGENGRRDWGHFTISGRITSESDSGPFHIVWRGRERFTEVRYENYAVSIVAEGLSELKDGPLVGVWLGRRTRATRYEPDLGYFVIVNEGFDWPSKRREIERRCKSLVGHLSLELPKTEPLREKK
jgi:DNA-binding transcriptional LysR family regulator